MITVPTRHGRRCRPGIISTSARSVGHIWIGESIRLTCSWLVRVVNLSHWICTDDRCRPGGKCMTRLARHRAQRRHWLLHIRGSSGVSQAVDSGVHASFTLQADGNGALRCVRTPTIRRSTCTIEVKVIEAIVDLTSQAASSRVLRWELLAGAELRSIVMLVQRRQAQALLRGSKAR